MNFLSEYFDSPQGEIHLWRRPSKKPPVIVGLHGFLQDAKALLPCLTEVTDFAEIVAIDLPGHGESIPAASMQLESLALMVSTYIQTRHAGRPLVLLGEGLGALVAAVASRDLPHPVLVLLDPPLSTAKQWWMIDQVRNLIGQASFRSLDRLAQSVLGIGRHEIIEKNYIETLFKPPLRNHFLLTGDVALWPRREMTGPLPTSLGEEDVLRLEHAYGQSLPILRIPNAGFPLTLNAAPIVADVLKQLILQL